MTADASTVPVVTEDDVEQRLGTADGVLVALDFDGTLAPIAEDPDAPELTDDNRQAIESLADRSGTTVAAISGRQLSDLRSRVNIDDIRYVGNHGLEYTVDGSRTVHPDARETLSQLREVKSTVETRLDPISGAEVEDKELTLTVHYRRAPEEHVDEILTAVREAVADADGLVTSRGKEIVEVRPDVEWDKGAAVEWLQSDHPDSWATVYVGDDVTDEDAFEVLDGEDLGVLVGERETAADYRVEAQSDVAPLLRWLDDAVATDS